MCCFDIKTRIDDGEQTNFQFMTLDFRYLIVIPIDGIIQDLEIFLALVLNSREAVRAIDIFQNPELPNQSV